MSVAPSYLSLQTRPFQFDAVSDDTQIFLDEPQRQLFVVTCGGRRVRVYSTDDGALVCEAALKTERVLSAVRLKPAGAHDNGSLVLTLVSGEQAMEFVTLARSGSTAVQTAAFLHRIKGAVLISDGYAWLSPDHVGIITNKGVEILEFIAKKQALKTVKSFSCTPTVSWFDWIPHPAILIVATGNRNKTIQSFNCAAPHLPTRLGKFDVDTSNLPGSAGTLDASDARLYNIYDSLYLVVLRNQVRAIGSTIGEILLYRYLPDTGVFTKTNVLRLPASGSYALNVQDDLVIAHHAASRTSVMFDLDVISDKDNYIRYHNPVLPPCMISVPEEVANVTASTYACSPAWHVSNPNTVIDAHLGLMWKLQVELSVLGQLAPADLLVPFFQRRAKAKSHLIDALNNFIRPNDSTNLDVLTFSFNSIAAASYSHTTAPSPPRLSRTSPTSPATERPRLLHTKTTSVLSQAELFRGVLQKWRHTPVDGTLFFYAVLMEYIGALVEYGQPVDFDIHSILIDQLLQKGNFYQLQQLLQYQVLSDSLQLAVHLLKICSDDRPECCQLALDMLKRLGAPDEQIIDVLVHHDELTLALKYAEARHTDTDYRKFLDVAREQRNPALYHTVYTLLISKGRHLDAEYETYYRQLCCGSARSSAASSS